MREHLDFVIDWEPTAAYAEVVVQQRTQQGMVVSERRVAHIPRLPPEEYTRWIRDTLGEPLTEEER